MKIYKFRLGGHKKYQGLAISFWRIKFEIIQFGRRFLVRIEFSNWN